MSGNSQRLSTYHNLELNLYLLSYKATAGGSPAFTRDIALVNKSYDNLDPRVGIAPNWLETMSPDVGRATGVQPVKQAALIEPYGQDVAPGNDPENEREIGFWVSEEIPARSVPLQKDVPNFDAAESGVKLTRRNNASRLK